MSLKLGLNLTKNYSINFDIAKRSKDKILFIVIHYTGMTKESEAIKKLCDPKSKVSSHYFIKNSGKVLNLVPDLYTAWHAGESYWKKFKSLNKYSIGIEISNPGHDNTYRKFSSKQIFSLIKLVNHLKEKYKIKKYNIIGHSDIAPSRKKDPGEKFPWRLLANKKLCIWHHLNENRIKKFRNTSVTNPQKTIFFNNLYKIGYSKIVKKKEDLVIAFQRRFRQKLINGKIDKECLLISQNLLKSK